MLKNKNIEVGDFKYIINGLDAISSISLLPVFQRVANAFVDISSGSTQRTSPDEFKEDLECLLYKSSILREIYDKSPSGNPLARDVTHHTQLPTEISDVGKIVEKIGSHLYGYELLDNDDKKK